MVIPAAVKTYSSYFLEFMYQITFELNHSYLVLDSFIQHTNTPRNYMGVILQ